MNEKISLCLLLLTSIGLGLYTEPGTSISATEHVTLSPYEWTTIQIHINDKDTSWKTTDIHSLMISLKQENQGEITQMMIEGNKNKIKEDKLKLDFKIKKENIIHLKGWGSGAYNIILLDEHGNILDELDPWWDSQWNNMMPFNITTDFREGTNITGYPVKINIPKQTGMQANCTDLRITNNTGDLQDHWIQHYDNDYCRIWTNTSLTNGTNNYRVYYNNSIAPDVSNQSNIPTLNSDGLVAYWTMDETAGVTAYDELKAWNLTATNALVFTSEADGIINTGADFTAGNYYLRHADLVNPLQFEGQAIITNSYWVQRQAINARHAMSDHSFRRSDTGGSGSMYFMEFQADNTIRFGGRSEKLDTFRSVTSPGTYTNTSRWYHIVGILDFKGKTIHLYVDGVLVANTSGLDWANDVVTKDATYDSIVYQHAVSGYASPTHYFAGVMDEIAAWNRTLNSSEIEHLYNTQKPVKEYVTSFGDPEQYQGGWPDVRLVSPANGTATSTASQDFEFYVIDNNTATLNCSLWVNGTSVATNSSALNNTNTTIAYTLNGSGTWQWEVTCSDSTNETGTDWWQITYAPVTNTTTTSTVYNVDWDSPTWQYCDGNHLVKEYNLSTGNYSQRAYCSYGCWEDSTGFGRCEKSDLERLVYGALILVLVAFGLSMLAPRGGMF